MAHIWIHIVSGLMIIIGIAIAVSPFDGETPVLFAYQIVILGAMLFGLGFLAIVIYALLSKKDISKEEDTASSPSNSYSYCQSCKRLMKQGTKFCAFCGSTQS